METRLAKTFLKAAEIGNITKTAEQLGYSQTAVTAQIKQLEASLGVRLFERQSGRSVQLTDAGRQLIPYAASLVQASEAADSFARQDEVSGHLAIQATTPQASYLLPELIAKFHEKYPKVTFSVRAIDNLDAMASALRQNQADFIFAINNHEAYAECTIAATRAEELIFVAHPDDPLAGVSDVPLEVLFSDACSADFIFPDKPDSYGALLENELSKRGIIPNIRMEMNSSIAIMRFLKADGGKTLMPRFTAMQEILSGGLVEINTERLEFNLWSMVYYHTGRWLSPPMQAFIDFLKEEL